MALNYVTLTLDLYDGRGNLLTVGNVILTPTAELVDSGVSVIPMVPAVVPLYNLTTPATISLLATDNAGPLPGSWQWEIQFSAVPGNPPAYSFFLPAAPFSFTATNASPCVFTATGSAYANGAQVVLSGASLPAGFTTGTTYYVVSASGTTFQLAATPGGAALGSTSTGSGTVQTSALSLSSLTPYFSAPAVLTYLPVPTGTPVAGQVPEATGTGEASAWTTVSGSLLATHLYAPSVLATPTVSSATLAAFDSTNIQTGNFIAPPSGTVIVEAAFEAAPPSTQVYGYALALHGTVTPLTNTVITSEVSSSNVQPFTALKWIVSGLTPGNTYNFDLLGAAATGSLAIRALGSASTTPTGQTGGPVVLTVAAV